MMLRKESSTWARLKVLLIVPLMAVLLLAFAQPERVEERIADHQSRKDAADYFLSVRNGQKDNYLAYLYLNTKDQLYLMNKNAEAASMEVFHLKEKSDLAKTLTDLITEAIRKTTSTDIHFILGAENDTKMKDVSFVKNVIRDAYHKSSCERALKKSVLLEELKEEFPLLITYTSVQTSSPGGIVKQVQENPFFYWEEVQQFCKEKGITPEDMKIKPGTNQAKRLLLILVNSRNQVMYQSKVSSKWFKSPEEANSDLSVEVLKKFIAETIKINDPVPIYFGFQHDINASPQFIFTFLTSTLPKAYETALNEISEHNNIPVEQLRKEQPLLLLQDIPKNYSGDANPREQEGRRNEKFIINVSVMKDGQEKNGYYSAVSYGEKEDLQTVSLHYEIVPDKSGSLRYGIISNKSDNESIIQELLSTISALEPADIALISVGSDMTKTDVDNINVVVDKKLKVKKSIFVLSI